MRETRGVWPARSLDLWVMRDSGGSVGPKGAVPGRFQMRTDDEIRGALRKLFERSGADIEMAMKTVADVRVDFPYRDAVLHITLKGLDPDVSAVIEALKNLSDY